MVDKIIDNIRDKIVQGEWNDGDSLPSQDKLAEIMGVSRGTLREALHQLAMMGIIEMRQGSGTYVTSITPASFMGTLAPIFCMDRSSIKDLLEARVYIEGAVAFLAAKRMAPEEVQELETLLNTMRDAVEKGQVENFSKSDIEFHLLIAKGSKNPVLFKMVETVRDMLAQFIADFDRAMPDVMKSGLDYHARIYRNIKQGDPLGAKKQSESHIYSLIRRIDQLDPNLCNQKPPDTK